MPSHKFKVGEMVELQPAANRYEMLMQLPEKLDRSGVPASRYEVKAVVRRTSSND